MTLKIELMDLNTGAPIAQAIKTENVTTVSFRFEDYLGKIGNAADSLVTSQVASQLENVLSPLMTDEQITEIALQRMGGDPTSPGLDLMKDQIRDELSQIRCVLTANSESVLRFGLGAAVAGDKLDHRFLMGATHPSAGTFAESVAASKAAWDRELTVEDIPGMVSFGLGGLPSTDSLKSLVSGNHTEEDILQLTEQLSVSVGIQTPEVRLLDSVGFSVGSRFEGNNLFSRALNLSQYEVNANLLFFPVVDTPPTLFGRKMRGSISGYFRQTLDGDELQESNGASSSELGVKAIFN